ncbi:MAG TPA: hypothetical protein PLF42_09490 [Anaerolineales bacterium]|nr:hypothetical protein [Anaerolineales bacterium]
MDTTKTTSAQAGNRLASFRTWVVNHDDSWLFIVLYIGLAVVLSIWISLFWLVAVVAVHFGFEVVRQYDKFSDWGMVVRESLWELKLDIALVLFALVVSLYMELALGVAGLQGAARIGGAGVRGGARFAAWQRIIRGLLLSVDDAAQVARVAVGKNKKSEEEGQAPKVEITDSSWAGTWKHGDWIAIGLGVVCFLLIASTPLLTDHTYPSTFAALAAELHPFPNQ